MGPKKVFLFIHVPKCAGTTVTQSFCKVGRGCAIVSSSPNSKLQARADLHNILVERHLKPDEVRAVMGHDVYYGMHQFSTLSPFYFTFLRNPVERYVSHYRHLVNEINDSNSIGHHIAVKKLIENGKLLTLSDAIERRLFANVMTEYLAAANHPDLATKRWECPGDKKPLQLAKELIRTLDFVGIVENMPADLNFVCKQMGVRPVSRKRNVAKAGECQLNNELINRIQKISRLDEKLYRFALAHRKKRSPGTLRRELQAE